MISGGWWDGGWGEGTISGISNIWQQDVTFTESQRKSSKLIDGTCYLVAMVSPSSYS